MPEQGWKTSRTLSWPEGFRQCTKCLELKPLDCFGLHKGAACGRNPWCKVCRLPISKLQWSVIPLRKKMLDRSKTRATKVGMEWNICLEDIPEIPERCPVFKIPMVGKYTPSLDRINNSKGYIKGNLQVISNRANTLKNNASTEELEAVVEWMKSIGTIDD